MFVKLPPPHIVSSIQTIILTIINGKGKTKQVKNVPIRKIAKYLAS